MVAHVIFKNDKDKRDMMLSRKEAVTKLCQNEMKTFMIFIYIFMFYKCKVKLNELTNCYHSHYMYLYC